ncbi:MAG: DUF1345 domain-containing protein [Steroidobacteraceae bacterium]|jgi:uncharacterized membrane protein
MIKLFRYHPRIWIGFAAGVLVYWLLPPAWSLISRVLVAWDSGVTLFLVLIFLWMRGLTAQQICSRYIEEDASAPVILVVVTAASLLSLAAIVEPLATLRHVQGSERIWHFILTAATLIDSWLLVPTMFTTHYADMFYSTERTDRPLSFPQTEMPVFWDFAYFSFTIAAACQTADVLTTRSSIRKVVIAHELISFAFNASILGFAINVTAGLIGN